MRVLSIIANLLVIFCFIPQSHAAKRSLPDVLNCESYLAAGTSLAGYLTQKVSVGDLFFLYGKPFVVVRAYMGGGGRGHGPHDRYPDTLMVDAQPLADDLTYNADRPTKKFVLRQVWMKGDVDHFYVFGKMNLQIADGQRYDPARLPKLLVAGIEVFAAQSASLKIGSVILHPDLNGLYVVVEADSESAMVSKLDPEKSTFSHSELVKIMPVEARTDGQIKVTGAVVVGFLSRLKDGIKPSYYQSWETFQRAYAEKPVRREN